MAQPCFQPKHSAPSGEYLKDDGPVVGTRFEGHIAGWFTETEGFCRLFSGLSDGHHPKSRPLNIGSRTRPSRKKNPRNRGPLRAITLGVQLGAMPG